MKLKQVVSDSRNRSIAAVLMQGSHPVAFEPRKMILAVSNYTVTEQEFLASVCAMKKKGCYRKGLPSDQLILVTDHTQVCTCRTSKT